MRALLIVNPHATSTTERRRDLIAHALAGEVSLRLAHTGSRGHAADLAAAAADAGVELVVVHGGDGTVNEVVNGLMYRGLRDDAPLLAVVPGGSTNVFARALGMSGDPTMATEQILEGLEQRRTRWVSLGKANDRYFTFNAGLGIDAETVREVERRRLLGGTISNPMHVRVAIRQFLATNRREPALDLRFPGRSVDGAFLLFVSNVNPWTYLGRRAVRTNPGTSADRGLGVFALTGFGLPTVAAAGIQILTGRSSPHFRHIVRSDDQPWVSVQCRRPVDLQADGDYLGKRSAVEFTSVPHALQIVL